MARVPITKTALPSTTVKKPSSGRVAIDLNAINDINWEAAPERDYQGTGENLGKYDSHFRSGMNQEYNRGFNQH